MQFQIGSIQIPDRKKLKSSLREVSGFPGMKFILLQPRKEHHQTQNNYHEGKPAEQQIDQGLQDFSSQKTCPVSRLSPLKADVDGPSSTTAASTNMLFEVEIGKGSSYVIHSLQHVY